MHGECCVLCEFVDGESTSAKRVRHECLLSVRVFAECVGVWSVHDCIGSVRAWSVRDCMGSE